MELARGETLAERIQRGPIPIDEAIVIARQIAEGLETAHENGIVHRDLKPANIKVTRQGQVKLLDFGLAKALAGEPADMTATNAGMIVGTVAYMSPEQAQGQDLDERSDIFSFGAVLCEMVSGKRPFVGNSTAELRKPLRRWCVAVSRNARRTDLRR